MAGCADGIEAGPEPEVDPDPPQTSTPSPNETAAPDPDEPGEVRPAVSLPGLPIGGSAEGSTVSAHPANQCVSVNWRPGDDGTADLPAGVAVRVTGFRFTPDAFVVSAWGCDDSRPACAGFVFTASTQLCNLAVAPRPAAGAVTNPLVALTGELSCRRLHPDVCQRFATEVTASENTELGLLPLEPSTSGPPEPIATSPDDPSATSSDDPAQGSSESPRIDPSDSDAGGGSTSSESPSDHGSSGSADPDDG